MKQSENKTALKIKYPDFSIDSEIDEKLAKELQNITYDKLTTSSTTRTIKNIKKNIIATLKSNYPFINGRVKEVADIILKKHGLHEDNFDFVNLFESGLHENINDISIDDNANKNEKVFRGYLNELEKSVDKLIGYDVLYRTMKDLYGEKEAKKLTGEMYTYALGLSDSSNVIVPYSYYGNTCIIVKINNEIKYLTFKKLFAIFEHMSKHNTEYDYDYVDTTNMKQELHFGNPINAVSDKICHTHKCNINLTQMPQKKIDIKVWDSDNGWVKITQILKHKNEKDFILYQTNNGNFAFVTEDHPVILADGSEIHAGKLSIGSSVLESKPFTQLSGNINVPYELAYFTGFAMGDGNYKSYDIDYKKQCDIDDSGRLYWRKGGNGIILYQKDILNSKIKQISDKLFNNPNYFKFNNTDDRRLAFSSADYNYLISKYFGFTHCENSFTKHLPENILDWDIESIESLIAGLIDSDGVVNPTKSEANIRLKSYAIITQLYDILLSMPNITAVVKNLIHDNKDNSNVGFGISFRVLPNSGIVDKSEKFYKNKNIPNYFEYDPQFCTSKRDNKIKKLIQFNRKDIHTKTGFYEAETEYVYDITTETGRFYANGMVQHNCWALDASKLVTIGREFGVLKSKPAKRVSSYISMLCETIHQMSNHLAGAIAIGSFFLDLAHLMIYKERRTLNELRTDKRIRKTIENEIQQFIHSINHLSRNGAESPFTNVSIFDRPKLEGLISDDNYGWYFPNHKAISTDNDLQDKMSNEDFKKYVIDYITEIQNLFMDFFEKGDPLQNGMPYRFPVATINFSKVKNESTGKFEIQDKEFLKAVCKRDISRFNIFSSAGTKICSCCRLINDIEMLDFASQSNSLGGGGSISLGSHRVITINFQRIALECQSFEDYLNILSFRVEEAAKILKAHKLMLLKFTKEGYEPFIANGFINPKRLASRFGLLGI